MGFILYHIERQSERARLSTATTRSICVCTRQVHEISLILVAVLYGQFSKEKTKKKNIFIYLFMYKLDWMASSWSHSLMTILSKKKERDAFSRSTTRLVCLIDINAGLENRRCRALKQSLRRLHIGRPSCVAIS